MIKENGIVPVLPVLFLAVLAVSFSAVLVRLSVAPSLVIAAYRLLFTVVFLAPATLILCKSELRTLSAGDLGRCMLSGLFLAIHFYAWMTSLQYTTVAASVLLVSLHPIFVALLGWYFFKEQIPGAYWFTLTLALLGTAVMGAGELINGSGAWSGNLLAMLGAFAMAVYLLIGRRLRTRLSTLTYTLCAYGSASLSLLIAVLLTSASLHPYPRQEYAIFLALALIPTLMGHTVFNWVLGKVPASFVAFTALGEPVGAGILAFFFLKETPTFAQFAGGVLILTGLYLGVRWRP